MQAVNYLFSQRLKELRTEKNISQNALAKILSLTQGHISAYENGKKLPSIETLWTIADLFQVSIDYLLMRTDERNTQSATKETMLYRTVERIINSNNEINLTVSNACVVANMNTLSYIYDTED